MIEREEKGMKKLAAECLKMTESLLAEGEYAVARKYLLFMQLVDSDIINSEEYKHLLQAWQDKDSTRYQSKEYGQTGNFSYRKRSYEPPEGYVLLQED